MRRCSREFVPPALPVDIPLVLLNCYDAAVTYASTVPDDEGGGFSLTSALLAAGHRRIGHLAGESWTRCGRERLAGDRRALADSGVVFDEQLISNLGSAVSAGHDGTHNLLDLRDPPTAMFSFNDRMAIGALEAARQRGLRVPEELSIVGFDDDPFARPPFPGALRPPYCPTRKWRAGPWII